MKNAISTLLLIGLVVVAASGQSSDDKKRRAADKKELQLLRRQAKENAKTEQRDAERRWNIYFTAPGTIASAKSAAMNILQLEGFTMSQDQSQSAQFIRARDAFGRGLSTKEQLAVAVSGISSTAEIVYVTFADAGDGKSVNINAKRSINNIQIGSVEFGQWMRHLQAQLDEPPAVAGR